MTSLVQRWEHSSEIATEILYAMHIGPSAVPCELDKKLHIT